MVLWEYRIIIIRLHDLPSEHVTTDNGICQFSVFPEISILGKEFSDFSSVRLFFCYVVSVGRVLEYWFVVVSIGDSDSYCGR